MRWQTLLRRREAARLNSARKARHTEGHANPSSDALLAPFRGVRAVGDKSPVSRRTSQKPNVMETPSLHGTLARIGRIRDSQVPPSGARKTDTYNNGNRCESGVLFLGISSYEHRKLPLGRLSRGLEECTPADCMAVDRRIR